MRENRPNLPKLLDSNEAETWMATEYFPGKTLADFPDRYQGNPLSALSAFSGLVRTIATSLHADKIVHRDIKPANVFMANDGRLIPGDFGIVFRPDIEPRPTLLGERVGPWEYMPPWADSLGEELEKVEPNFDVYMLRKLLWCMVAGRLKLRREDHREPEYDLAKKFPGNRQMHLINSILDKCLVKRPSDCLPSAAELLKEVQAALATIRDGVPLTGEKGELILPCRACGRGFYQDQKMRIPVTQTNANNMPAAQVYLWVFVCNVCAHYEFFAPGYPGESADRGWTPWRT